MSAPDEPDSSTRPDRQPMRDLLLAQALDACITAERELPGSSEELIARQPAWARAELRRLVGLAGSLDAATSNAFMSDEFRVRARGRLMRRIGGTSDVAASVARPDVSSEAAQLTAMPVQRLRPVATRRKLSWVWRSAAGLVAAMVGVVATLSASANALPGEPLYSVKEAHEELEVRMAGSDEARASILLRLADARLAETERLLQLGRTAQLAGTTQRYDNAVESAALTYATSVDAAGARAQTSARFEIQLDRQQDELQTLLLSAPEQARAELRDALVTTQRGRALVAEAHPLERAQARVTGPQLAAVVPTVVDAVPVPAAEEQSTPQPTSVVTEVAATPMVVAANPTDAPFMTPLIAQSAAEPKRATDGDQLAVEGAASDDAEHAVTRTASEGDTGRTVKDASGNGSAMTGPPSLPAAVPAPASAPAPKPARSGDATTNGSGGTQPVNALRAGPPAALHEPSEVGLHDGEVLDGPGRADQTEAAPHPGEAIDSAQRIGDGRTPSSDRPNPSYQIGPVSVTPVGALQDTASALQSPTANTRATDAGRDPTVMIPRQPAGPATVVVPLVPPDVHGPPGAAALKSASVQTGREATSHTATSGTGPPTTGSELRKAAAASAVALKAPSTSGPSALVVSTHTAAADASSNVNTAVKTAPPGNAPASHAKPEGNQKTGGAPGRVASFSAAAPGAQAADVGRR